MTTNFDQPIEKAMECEGKQLGRDYNVIYREEDFAHIDWADNRCRLIKIHGSIDDKKAMAITLSQVSRHDLSAPRASIIRHVFSEGNHKIVLIMGYSCSDVFDLSPQIEALTKNLKPVCLVQHSQGLEIQNIREQKQKNLFKIFDTSIRLFIDTDELVKALWKATLKDPYPDHKPLKTTLDWKTKVQAWYVDCTKIGSEYKRDIISGEILSTICDWRTAIGRYERVLTYAKMRKDLLFEELALNNLGRDYFSLGEYRKAIGFSEQALAIAHSIGNVKGEEIALGNVGNAYSRLGEYRKAIELYKQALVIARRIGDQRGECNALGAIGIGFYNLGEYRRVIDYMNRLWR